MALFDSVSLYIEKCDSCTYLDDLRLQLYGSAQEKPMILSETAAAYTRDPVTHQPAVGNATERLVLPLRHHIGLLSDMERYQ